MPVTAQGVVHTFQASGTKFFLGIYSKLLHVQRVSFSGRWTGEALHRPSRLYTDPGAEEALLPLHCSMMASPKGCCACLSLGTGQEPMGGPG